ncbi:MAG: amidohydrolase family protein [Pseudomonadota bacterium]
MSASNTQAVTGWDCHAHLFGPYAKFPLAADRSYTPPEALQEQYLALLARLGLSHGVLVHPSAYGEDYALLFNALAALPQLRGVIVARPGSLSSLKGLREKGVRALRYSHRSGAGANFAGSASFDDLTQMAGSLVDAGLHAELWTDCKVLPGIAQALQALPVPVVIDHMGGFDVSASINDPGFRALLSLVESGKAWVKLCAYRNLLTSQDAEAGEPFHQALLQANPGRLLWGSDWPHLRVAPEPDAAQLLAMFKRWTANDALASRILVDNPNALYG